MLDLPSLGRPSPRALVTGLAVLGALVLTVTLVAVLLTSGSDGDDGPVVAAAPSSSTTSTPPADPAAYLETPDGVGLTELGTVLAPGEPATVAWRPTVDSVGVVELTVREMRPAPLAAFEGWLVGGTGLQAAPYFVGIDIRNVGGTDLASASLPLYLERQDGRLVPAARFGAPFPACASTDLPGQFAPGATQRTCQVYLSEGGQAVESLAFLPYDGAEPIRWDPSLPAVVPGAPTTSAAPSPTGSATGSATSGATGTQAPTSGATSGTTGTQAPTAPTASATGAGATSRPTRTAAPDGVF